MAKHDMIKSDRQSEIVSELVRLIHDGPFEARPWERFVKALRHCFSASAVGLTLQQPATIRPLLLFTLDGNFDNTVLMERYLNRFSDEDPFPYQDLEPNRVYSLSQLVGENWKDEVYHREFLHPFGFDDMLLVRIEVQNELNAYVFVGRSENSERFSEAEICLIRRILPDLRQALHVSSMLKRLEAERLVYEEAIEAMGIGTILLGGAGQVIYTNPLARMLLANQSTLSLCDARLTCARSAQRRLLKDMIGRALADLSGKFARAFPLSSGEHGELLLLIRAVAYPLSVSDEPGPRVVIFLSDRGTRPVLPREVISELFGLTPSEADLSIKLSEGASLAEAAALLNISEQTARTYSKRIYAKTGTSRQSDLVQLILAGVARLGSRRLGVVDSGDPRFD